MPEGWFEASPTIDIDGDEIQVVGTLASPQLPEGAGEDEIRVAEQARISGFREETRGRPHAHRRRGPARLPPHRLVGRRVRGLRGSSSPRPGVPVMTRLRLSDRRVLDTLIDAGVARSRSEALAWCVRLVARHESDWIEELRDAMTKVEEVRTVAPGRQEADRPWRPGRRPRRGTMPHGPLTTRLQEDLRGPYRALRRGHPRRDVRLQRLSSAAMADGALPARTKELIALAISITRECDGCIVAHARGAVRRGATAAEVAETIGVAISLNGGPGTVWGARALAAFHEFSADAANLTAARASAALQATVCGGGSSRCRGHRRRASTTFVSLA